MSAVPSRGRNVLFRLFILGQLADDLLGRAMTGSKGMEGAGGVVRGECAGGLRAYGLC